VQKALSGLLLFVPFFSAIGVASCFSVTFGILHVIVLPKLTQNCVVILFRSYRPHLRTEVYCLLRPVEWQTVTVILNDLQGHAAQTHSFWTILSVQ
jgi:hypothetical protein